MDVAEDMFIFMRQINSFTIPDNQPNAADYPLQNGTLAPYILDAASV
jgi:hypothetical protein